MDQRQPERTDATVDATVHREPVAGPLPLPEAEDLAVGEPGAVTAAAADAVAQNPRLASQGPVPSVLSPHLRAWIIGVIAVIGVAYLLFGTVLARNVSYNIMTAIDPGSSTALRRYQRQSIVSIWHTMVDRAPDFGSVTLMQAVLIVSVVVFVVAAVAVCYIAFVPSEEAWASDIGARRDGAANRRDE